MGVGKQRLLKKLVFNHKKIRFGGSDTPKRILYLFFGEQFRH